MHNNIAAVQTNKMRLKTEEEEHKRLETEVEYKKLENELISLKMNQTISELEKTKTRTLKPWHRLSVKPQHGRQP